MDLMPPELIVMIKDLLTNKDLWTFNCVHPYINYHTISKRQLYLRQHKVWNISIQDARAQDNYALRWAAICGNLKVIQYLVETVHLTADDARSCNNDALRWAATAGHLKIVRYLVETVGLTADDIRAQDYWASRYGACNVRQYIRKCLNQIYNCYHCE